MRPTIPLFVRIIRRNTLIPTVGRKPEFIIPEPIPQTKEKKIVLIDELMELKESMGSSWPPNLRVEPTTTKETFARVHGDYRTELKALLREK